jgi:hypothetical protein
MGSISHPKGKGVATMDENVRWLLEHAHELTARDAAVLAAIPQIAQAVRSHGPVSSRDRRRLAEGTPAPAGTLVGIARCRADGAPVARVETTKAGEVWWGVLAVRDLTGNRAALRPWYAALSIRCAHGWLYLDGEVMPRMIAGFNETCRLVTVRVDPRPTATPSTLVDA